MSLNIETSEAIKELFKKSPHNIGSHSFSMYVRYGHVEFCDSANENYDDHIDEIERENSSLKNNLNEIINLANAALMDETIEKDDLLDIISEISILAE